MSKLNSPIALGTYDVFRDVKNWDEQTANQWAAALSLRAGAEDQQSLRSLLISTAQVQPKQTVVEIGCGTGALLIDIAHAVGALGHVIGVEPQPILAQVARQAISQQNLGHIISVLTDSAEHLPLVDAMAEICFAQTVLIHLSRDTCVKTLQEMSRIVKKGGRILSADQDGDTWIINHPERELTRRIIQFNSDQRYADGWTGRHLESLFRSVGLIHVKATPHTHIDRSRDSYLFGMAKRIAAAARNAGCLHEDEYLLWLNGLEDLARNDEFFSSINYYCCVGFRP